MEQAKAIVLAHELLVTLLNVIKALRDGVFLFLPRGVVQGCMGEGAFAFVVHPRDLEDFYIPFPFARHLPMFLQKAWTWICPPIVLDRIYYQNSNGGIKQGYLLATTMLAETMFPPELMESTNEREEKKRRQRKLKKRVMLAGWRVRLVCRLAWKLGCKITGLGALTPAVTGYGMAVKHNYNNGDWVPTNRFPGMGVTTGHAYTSLVIARYVTLVLRQAGMPFENSVVAIVGAAGSTGGLVAQILLQQGTRFSKLILIDRAHKLDSLSSFADAAKMEVDVSADLGSLKQADVIVTVTNALETILRREDLKAGAIVIDDAQPPNAGPELMSNGDVIVIQVLCTDPGIWLRFPWNIPQGTSFTCLGEVLILAENGYPDDFAIGRLTNLTLVDRIRALERNTGVRHAKFTCFGHRIPETVWVGVRKAVRTRIGGSTTYPEEDSSEYSEGSGSNFSEAEPLRELSIRVLRIDNKGAV